MDLTTLTDAQLESMIQRGQAGSRGSVTVKPYGGGPTDLSAIPDDQLDAMTMQRQMEQASDISRAVPRWPAQSSAQRLATNVLNIGPAASQGVAPNVNRQGRLVSDRTSENDAGEILYEDPNTGQLVPTNTATQVAIRDPADGGVKIFERTEAATESKPVSVARILSLGLGAGAPVARPGIPLPPSRSTIPRASDIFASAKAPYRQFEEVAKEIPIAGDQAGALADRIRGALDSANFIPELAGPVYSAAGILEKGGGTTLAKLQNVRRTIDRSLTSPDANVRNAAQVARREVTNIIRETSPEAASYLKEADTIQRSAYAMRDIQQKQAIAGLRTGRAGFGGNRVNAIRQVLHPIVEKAEKGITSGFRPDEIAAIREIEQGTRATNTARLIAQFSPAKGFGSFTAIGAGVLSGEPAVAAGLAVLGASANKLAAILTVKQLDNVRKLIASNSPSYAKDVVKATERFSDSYERFIARSSTGNLADMVKSARSLSGYTGVASGDILKSVQGPMRAAAEQEQQQP